MKAIKNILMFVLSLMIALGNTVVSADERIELESLVDALTNGDAKEIEALVHKDETGIVEAEVDAVINIDETREQIYRPNMIDMLGVQYETNGGYENVVDINGNLTSEYLEVASKMFPQPVVRWGGTSSKFYNMMDVIGPQSERKKSTLLTDIGYENYAPNADYASSANERDTTYGPVEFIKAQQANNPDVKFCFCLSVNYAHAEDNANFIRFLRDEKDESEWGALRASYGIEEPVNVWGIELGNEMYFKSSPTPELEASATKWYVDTFKKHAEAINAVDPDIICIPCVNGNSDRGAAFYSWNDAILRGLGDKYKVMAFHFYYSGYEYAYNGHWFDDFMQECKDVLGEDHGIKLAITEHARWGTSNYITRAGLTSALATAQFLNIMYQRDDNIMATVHCGTNSAQKNGWYFYKKNGDDNIVFSSLPYLYKIYIENIGDRVLPVDVESDNEITDPASTHRYFTALATPKGSKELVLFLSNRDPYTDFNLTINANNNYTLKKEIVFTAPNIYSFEYDAATQDVFSVVQTDKNEKNFKNYHMPTKSFVCLVLESDKAIPNANDTDVTAMTVSYEGESHFDDVTGHWAENEIELLAQDGIVSGIDVGKFEPQNDITFAEFSSMVERGAGFDDEVTGDVRIGGIASEDWYYKAISSLVLRGYIKKSDLPEADGCITLRQALELVYNVIGNTEEVNRNSVDVYPWACQLTDYERTVFNSCIESGLLNRLFEASDSSPDRNLTRGEAAAIVYRMRNIIGG